MILLNTESTLMYRWNSFNMHYQLSWINLCNYWKNNQLLYNYWLLRHWTWCDIDLRVPILTEAEPRSILVFSGRYHIMSNASIVNNYLLYNFSKQRKATATTTKSWLWTMSWTVLNFFFYMMTNWFHSVKRGMNAYFICNYNYRQRRSKLNDA